MKKSLACALFLVVSLSAVAVLAEDLPVAYAGGTVPSLTLGTTGRLVTTQAISLVFEHSGGSVTIPYDKIQSFEYSREVARHLGVLPAIAVGLIKRRQSRHFVRITYFGEGGLPQVAVFEVPKQMPQVLLAVLRTKAPQGCPVKNSARCGEIN
jgi:hypothetical protein